MKLFPTLLVLVGAAGLALTANSLLRTPQEEAPPTLPVDPARAPVELLSAQAFQLDRPATHWYRAEQPSYTSGVVIVVHAEPDLLVPRQTLEPVLYVGGETAQRVNHGATSGNLVAIVPYLTLDDLAQAPIFFGTPELPERVTLATAAEELDSARIAGATAPGAARVAEVTGETLITLDDDQLRAAASALVTSFAPSDSELAEGLRAERLDLR